MPAGQSLYSSLDEVLGHRTRYSQEMLREELQTTGFTVEEMRDFNRTSVPGWWLNGRVLKRRNFSRVQLKLFNMGVPIIRRLDRMLPWKGLGIIAVARRD